MRVALAELADGNKIEWPLGHDGKSGAGSREALEMIVIGFVERDDGLDDADGGRDELVVSMTAIHRFPSGCQNQKVLLLGLPLSDKLF